MAINNILIIFFTFFSLIIAKSKNETSMVEIPRESTTQQNTGVPFITNLTDTTQNGPLFDQEIWCCKSGTKHLPG